jgi:hypothetical protein
LGDEFVDENTSNGGDLYDAALEPSNDDDSALNISSVCCFLVDEFVHCFDLFTDIKSNTSQTN